MDSDHSVWLRVVYVILSAVAGAITALAFMRWREMPWPDRLLTVFVGASFALIFVPWLVADVFHVNIAPLRAACAITYIGAVGANSFIPLIIANIKKKFGAEEGAN